jgi:hypothetical protein
MASTFFMMLRFSVERYSNILPNITIPLKKAEAISPGFTVSDFVAYRETVKRLRRGLDCCFVVLMI